MYGIAKLANVIQEYPWGSHEALPRLLGRAAPSPRPQAELWMGAHPKGPSRVLTSERERPLPELISEAPEALLGKTALRRFGPRLPFLFKILAAREPLSIQVHPDRRQAREGFLRENAQGLAPEAAERNYADDNHKPEILCALSRFWALSGLRPLEEILRLFEAFGLGEVPEFARALHADGPLSAAELYRSLVELPPSSRLLLADVLRRAAKGPASRLPEARWVLRALDAHPGDAGAAAVLMLNLVELAPTEAIYQAPGVLHAYLEGTGVELMANSDNVVRGGLTQKKVDVAELMRIARFEPSPACRVTPQRAGGGELLYPTPAEEFLLARIELQGSWEASERCSIELWIVTEGSARAHDGANELLLGCGESFVVPACAPRLRLEGEAVLFRASVPCR